MDHGVSTERTVAACRRCRDVEYETAGVRTGDPRSTSGRFGAADADYSCILRRPVSRFIVRYSGSRWSHRNCSDFRSTDDCWWSDVRLDCSSFLLRSGSVDTSRPGSTTRVIRRDVRGRTGIDFLYHRHAHIIPYKNMKISIIPSIFNIKRIVYSSNRSDLGSILIRAGTTVTGDPRASGIRYHERCQRILSQDRCFALGEAVLCGR